MLDSRMSRDALIGSALAITPFGCPPVVTKALHAAVERHEFGYVSSEDTARLGEATAGWLLQEYGWGIPAEAVRPVADLVAGLRAVLTHFVPLAEPIIVPTPAYMPFLSMPPSIGRPVIEVPMLLDDAGWHYDLDGIAAAFGAGARLLVLCNPHNPIGKVATGEELDAIESLVDHAGGLVFSDEIHAPIRFGGRSHLVYAARSPRAAMQTITATSASKAFNIPGVKCGQLVFTNPEHLDRWMGVARWHEHQTSSLGMVATRAAYAEGRPWLDELVEYLEQTVAEATEVLLQEDSPAHVVAPEATYLLWIDLRETRIAGERSASLGDRLLRQAGLVVTDGTECGRVGAGFVRFNAALPRSEVREAMRRFAEAARS